MTRLTNKVELLREKGWVPATEAADLLGCHPTSIYKYIKLGKVVSTKVGGSHFVTIASIREFLGDAAEAMLGPEGPNEGDTLTEDESSDEEEASG